MKLGSKMMSSLDSRLILDENFTFKSKTLTLDLRKLKTYYNSYQQNP